MSMQPGNLAALAAMSRETAYNAAMGPVSCVAAFTRDGAEPVNVNVTVDVPEPVQVVGATGVAAGGGLSDQRSQQTLVVHFPYAAASMPAGAGNGRTDSITEISVGDVFTVPVWAAGRQTATVMLTVRRIVALHPGAGSVEVV